MLNLNGITIGGRHRWPAGVADNVMVMLLSASRNGWRSLKVGSVRFGEAVKAALVEHYHTLESLDVALCRDFTGADLVQVLSSCPNLHTLNDFYDDSRIGANTFIDRDPTAGLLKSW